MEAPLPSCASWRSLTSPVPVSSTSTCCMRVCRSHPTNVMASAPFLGALSPRASIATARDRSHDISELHVQLVGAVDGAVGGVAAERPAHDAQALAGGLAPRRGPRDRLGRVAHGGLPAASRARDFLRGVLP